MTDTRERVQTGADPAKLAAAEAILTGSNITTAAEKAGVHRNTVSRWAKHDLEFRAIITELRAGTVRITTDRIAGLAETAVDTLAEICKDPEAKGSDRVSAAKAILERVTPDDPTDTPLNPRDILGDERYEQVLEMIRSAGTDA